MGSDKIKKGRPTAIASKGFFPHYPPLLMVEEWERPIAEAYKSIGVIPPIYELHPAGFTPTQAAFYLAQGVFCNRALKMLKGRPNEVLSGGASAAILQSDIQALSAEINHIQELAQEVGKPLAVPAAEFAYAFVLLDYAYSEKARKLDGLTLLANEVGGSKTAKKTSETLTDAFQKLLQIWTHLHGLKLIAEKWAENECELDAGTLSAFEYYSKAATHRAGAIREAFKNACAQAKERRGRGAKTLALPYTSAEVLAFYESLPKGSHSDYDRYAQTAEHFNVAYPKAPNLSDKKCKQLCTEARKARKAEKGVLEEVE